MKKKRLFFYVLTMMAHYLASGQIYDDYIGAGHNQGITVTSSSDLQQTGWSQTASAEKTINGDGLEGKLSEAARFLSQAAISHDQEEIEHVAEIGIEAWIDEQIAQDYTLHLPIFDSVLADHHAYQLSIGDTVLIPAVKSMQRTTYWRMNMLERDFLRDKLVAAWLEILVISIRSDISPYGQGVMDYLDIFKRNAFGNFRDIIGEVTLHPSMGIFLSHHNNRKADTTANTLPDENFSREIMQLFTIGLNEMNNDGTFKTDADGDLIPTYNNADIGEMAKVFTGLSAGQTIIPGVVPLFFGLPVWAIDYTVPMIMYEEHHEPSAKSIFNGDLIIPANQSGMEDIEMVLDYLFNHPNTPPFICQRMIQLLVKSNPTPAYVNRVANVFINDGNGVRGDMEAVIKAILLDEEARTCFWQSHPDQGKLKNATDKGLQFARIVDFDIPSGEIWTDGSYQEWTAVHLPMNAPSVFNWHERDFIPFGEIGDAGLVAPEFQMLNNHTSIGYANLTWRWFHLTEAGEGEFGFGSWRDPSHAMRPVYNNYFEAGQDAEALINMLDLQFTNGNMTPFTRSVIKDLIVSMDESFFPNPSVHLNEYHIEKVKHAIIMLLLSPDFNILK